MTTSKTPILDELLKGLGAVAKADGKGPPAAQAVLEAAEEKIGEALKSVKAAGGLTMELAGELKGVGDSLIKLSTPQAPPAEGQDDGGGGDGMADKEMTKAEFAAHVPELMKAMQAEKDPEKKRKRADHLAKVLQLAKSNFETSETVKVPPIEEAFKGSGGGSTQDLTSVQDQSTTETKVGAGGGQQGGGQFASNGTSQGAQPGPTGDPMMKLVPALLKELGVEPNPGGTKPTDDGGGGRSHFAKGDQGFTWPRDMQRAVRDDAVAKRDAAKPKDNDGDWGRDPWA